MKAAIITIAGLSSRFNQGVSAEQHRLKAIYYEANEHDTLLYHMVNRLQDVDRIILVAGYKKEDLEIYINNVFPPNIREKISVVINDHFDDWASGYSLYIGIKEVLKYNPESVLFAEGDLDVDNSTLDAIKSSKKSIITCNHDIIRSNKSVIGYCAEDGKYKYVFSESHGLASIAEKFSLLFNSGQIWKFTNMEYLSDAVKNFERIKETGTNLVIVADYFNKEKPRQIELLEFKRWINCNTREDYRRILTAWEAE